MKTKVLSMSNCVSNGFLCSIINALKYYKYINVGTHIIDTLNINIILDLNISILWNNPINMKKKCIAFPESE